MKLNNLYINLNFLDDFLTEKLNISLKEQELTHNAILIFIPLIITALLFFLSGIFFKSSKKNIKNNISNNKDEYREKFLELYKITQGKKIIFNDDENSKIKIKSSYSPNNIFEKIPGINSKIQQILLVNQIDSYEKLANIEQEKLNEILEKFIGTSYKIYQPNSWIQQAKDLINNNNSN